MRTTVCAFAILSMALMEACGPPRSVQRVAVDTQVDLSGRWNDTDSRMVAEQMISTLLSKSWIAEFVARNHRKPTVIVGTVRNLSDEHIESAILTKDVERELVNSGKVNFVATKEERQEVRDERLDQQSNSSEESAKRLAAETGADFMLKGSIKTQSDRVDGKEVKFYQVDLELVNLENNIKIWMDGKKIKKIVEKSSVGW